VKDESVPRGGGDEQGKRHRQCLVREKPHDREKTNNRIKSKRLGERKERNPIGTSKATKESGPERCFFLRARGFATKLSG